MAAINCPRCNSYSSPSLQLVIEHLHTHIRPFRCANCPHDESRPDRIRTHTCNAHGRTNLVPGEAPSGNFRALLRVEAAGGPFVILPPRPIAPAANPPPAGPMVAILPAPVVVAAAPPLPPMAPPLVVMAAPPAQQQRQPLPPPPFANPLPPPLPTGPSPANIPNWPGYLPQ